jgi:hypothetical protein
VTGGDKRLTRDTGVNASKVSLLTPGRAEERSARIGDVIKFTIYGVMNEFRIDESRWPLVVVTFPASTTAQQYRDLFKQYVALSQRGDRIGYVIDMRSFNPIMAPAALRKVAAETFAQCRHHLVKATVCEARVVDNALTSGVLTAFDWLTGQKWPCANFTSMDEGHRWVGARMRAAGLATGAPA